MSGGLGPGVGCGASGLAGLGRWPAARNGCVWRGAVARASAWGLGLRCMRLLCLRVGGFRAAGVGCGLVLPAGCWAAHLVGGGAAGAGGSRLLRAFGGLGGVRAWRVAGGGRWGWIVGGRVNSAGEALWLAG